MLTLLAAVVAASLLAGLGARAMTAHPSPCPEPVVAHVAVPSELTPVTTRLATFFNRQHRLLNGHCEQVALQVAAPASVAASLAAGNDPGLSAWIPDSQLWIDIARGTAAGATRVPESGPVIAKTALVIAMPRAAAANLPAFGSSVGWNFLLPEAAGGPSAALGLNVQFPDPTQSAAGLTSLVEFRNLLGYGRPARFALARFAFTSQVVPGPAGASLTSLGKPPSKGGSSNPVTITTEQAVHAYDKASPQQPLAVRYPAQGTGELRYSYLLTTNGALTSVVAKAFGAVLQSSYASAYLRYVGFRSGTGQAGHWPASFGLSRAEPKLLPQPKPGRRRRRCAPGTGCRWESGCWRSTTSPPRWPSIRCRAGRRWRRCWATPPRSASPGSPTAPRWACGPSPATSGGPRRTSSWSRSARCPGRSAW
jgi:hypothetical protein